jgi:propanol-preferring alcohol dehydrogenase
VTVYKGLKETEVKPGEWVVISGIGGLGHMAVQYAKAMGLNVIAVDVDDAKLELARKLGASLGVNARKADPAAFIKKEVGGAQGVLVTAVSPKAFEQTFDMLRSHGTMSLVGLPPGKMALSIFHTVLKRITVRGSIVGTRQDLEEALAFAGDGAVAAHFSWDKLENINDIFARMEEGKIDGRIVAKMD